MATDNYLPLSEALPQRALALFLGADFPRDVTGLPSRADLAREMARRYNLDESRSLAEVAQRVSQAGNRFEFTDFIRNALDTAGKSPSAFHRGIVALVKEHGINIIITTAFDNLLEVAFQQAGVGINRVVRGSDVSFIRPDRPTLIKLYGDAQQPDTLVVTDRDHSQLLRDRDKEDVIDEVRRAFQHNTILIYGYDLSDPDFKFLYDQIAESKFARLAYAVWPGLPEADVRMWRDRGIVILGEDPLGVMGGAVMGALANVKASAPQMEPAEPGSTVIISERPPSPEPASPATMPIDVQTLRVDAAVPEQVFLDRVFDLAVAVRQMTSPLLAMKDLTHVESGEVQTTWEAGTPLINLRAEVDAPDCEIAGKRSIQFRLVRGKDAPPIYFHLKPRRAGELSIVVTVYQEDYWLGSARVNTVAAEQAAQPAGKVQLTVASQPLWLDCELRILEPIDHDYRVELTLNGEQTFGGTASVDLATWVATGDPAADGQALFRMLLTGDELLKAWGEARGRSKQRRVRLRIDPPALHALSWELLRDGDELIAADADTPFSRYWAIGKEWGRALADRPVRVLALISNPIDLGAKYNLPPADVELEEKTLREAFSPLSPSGKGIGGEGVSLTFLSPPITLDRLEAALRNGYHVLHFIGHGGFNVKQQQAALYFESDDRTARRVVDADFAGMLNRLQTPPQLVVLAACQSATQSLREVFTGLGPRLVQIGVPAVVAMHADITMLTARQFAATFYRQLLAHGTVDLALNEARSTLITNGRFDAAVPVLFMRLRDGRLWSAAPAAQAIQPPVTPPSSSAPLSKEERQSLERQLKSARENLRLIEERKAEYVLEADVPLQLIKEERRLKERLAELERKLSAGE